MALLRPSLTLMFDLDSRIASEDTVLELKRCYTYIGAPLVRTHTAEDEEAPISNIARVIVGFGQRKYLRSADEGADELWETIVKQWIGNMLHKIGSNMRQFNERQRSIGLPMVLFDRFNIELQGGEFVVSFRPDMSGYLGSERLEAVDVARTLLNQGIFADAKLVRIPAEAAFTQQEATAREAWTAEHPEEELVDATVPVEPAEPEPGIEKYFDEEWLAADAEAKSYETTAVPITDSEELPSFPREEEPELPELFNFELDYSLWDVHFADGTVKTFNAETREFVGE